MATIMIVDDEEPVRSVIREIIAGYRSDIDILEACDGREAVEIMKANHVNMVFTDIVMPNKSGLDLIMELRDEFPEMPIIAMSGGGGITGRFDYLPIAKLIGALQIINKPFDNDQIRCAVNDAILQ